MSRKSKKKINLLLIVAVVIILILIRFVEETDDIQPEASRFTVTRIFDGDTFEIGGGDKVRILSIDTPEQDEMYYQEAKQLLSDLILGKTVSLSYGSTRRDKYGRLLAYVYLDTLFINQVILENGLGYLYLFKDTELQNKQTKKLLSAQRYAIQKNISLWSIRKSPEAYYLNKKNSFRLHRPGCTAVSGSKEGSYHRYKTRRDGLWEGLSPCRTCRP